MPWLPCEGFYESEILRYKQAAMEEPRVHFYNVITGRCACGAVPVREPKSFSVFPELVNCPQCLTGLKPKDEKSEGKSG